MTSAPRGERSNGLTVFDYLSAGNLVVMLILAVIARGWEQGWRGLQGPNVVFPALSE